ncbi:protein crumbs homolog 3 isoform X2 [Lepus europaeus]|uniref:protein crumbs homolog 3 isoform X2 n=1 Tax=Lepus europaeus TaxID=9983 RepID=UPI002B47359E|nr:protein crumbs homolog 3 isoform X2 [Lepus europaeus]
MRRRGGQSPGPRRVTAVAIQCGAHASTLEGGPQCAQTFVLLILPNSVRPCADVPRSPRPGSTPYRCCPSRLHRSFPLTGVFQSRPLSDSFVHPAMLRADVIQRGWLPCALPREHPCTRLLHRSAPLQVCSTPLSSQ